MKKRCVILAAAVVLAAAATSSAFDSVRTTKTTITGRVRSVSPVQVTVERGTAGGLTEDVPVNEIIMISYDEDPGWLKTARAHLAGGRLEECLATLERGDATNVTRPEILQDLDYLKAYCQARIALGGGGGADAIANAGRDMVGFVNKHTTSFHWLEANEIVGDLLVAAGSYDRATPYYERVAQAPWPDFKMRANVAKGRALLAQNKFAEAATAFDQVLAINAEGELADSQRMAATLGKARVMAGDNKPAEAIKMVEDIIARANPEQSDLLARAYNTLGTAQRLANQPKEALMSFLHTDILYHGVPEAHAEALFNLTQLWEQLRMTERATESRTMLDQRYRNSPWAKKGG